jgi:hypothetical protein
LEAFGHILAVGPSYLADNTHRSCDLTFPHKILLAKSHVWMKILKISIDLASWHPVSKENSKGRVKVSLFR